MDLIRVLEQIDSLHARAWRTANNKSARSRVPFAGQPVILRIDTSSSFNLYLIAAAEILALTYFVLRVGFSLVERGVKIRKEWHEGTKAKLKVVKAEQEITKLKRELEIPHIHEEDELRLIASASAVVLRIKRRASAEYDLSVKELTREEIRLLIDHGMEGGREVDSIAIRVEGLR